MAQPRYSFDDVDERQPLDNSVPTPRRGQPHAYQDPYQDTYQQDYTPQYGGNQQQYRQQYPQHQYQPQQHHQPSPNSSPPKVRPGAHPDSSFDRLRAQRRYSQERPGGGALGPPVSGTIASNNYGNHPALVSPISPPQPPQPPSHRDVEGRQWDNTYAAQRRPLPQSNITPGADNFSDAAAGGMAGIALTVADRNARESGIEAIQSPDYPQQAYRQQRQWQPQGQGQGQGYGEPLARGVVGDQPSPRLPYNGTNGYGADGAGHSTPYSSLQGLNGVPNGPGSGTPGQRTPSRSPHSFANDIYTDDPYQSYSRPQDPRLGVVDPHDIEDDGDDGLEYVRKGPRTSMLSLGGSSQRSRDTNGAGAGAVGGATAAGAAMGGLAGRNGSGPSYAPVHNLANSYHGSGGDDTHVYNGPEKSQWGAMREKEKKTRKKRIIIIVVILILALAGIVVGVLFGIVFNKKDPKAASNGSGGSGTVASQLGANSDEVQALMNNPNLHKIFPGIDYTALNTQYPDCVHSPPSQDNVTLDVTILSQLTNTIRLYGTDCNQTQMVIHALDVLNLKDTVKVWLGVWQDNNSTTNSRQLTQMWDILDEYGAEPFKGVIVANEILFRQQMTSYELGNLLDSVRAKLKQKKIDLPVATSDLGDKWDATLAAKSDYIMGNIHPFFGGIPVDDAAAWTWTFWDQKTVGFAKADKSKNIISETGWPSQGGTHCGGTGTTTCAKGSTAGIDELNKFMEDWVCSALNNGTEYFWFEAFDEPWKVKFNTGDQQWEDHWGLIDVNRNLKDGIKIPDCGGKTI